ncbi:MAG TPA: SdrD B-like domain-containing protein, partial [Roseiflexaceae bacterium]
TTTGRTAITTLTPGENDLTWDSGMYYSASLGDRVWLDQNANGIQDTGEPGVPGVIVTLYTSGGVQVGAPVPTDANGNYAFPDLPPGEYYVVFAAPSGYIISPPDQGTDDSADSDADTTTGSTATTTITLGEHDPTWDAGLYLQVSLGNLVWNDVNNNGVVDSGESGIDGVVVNLYRDANDNGRIDAREFVATQATSGGGQYLFAKLMPGSYLVQLAPSNFTGAGVLTGYRSSTGGIGTNISATGPYEPAPGPNNDVNNDDNGSAVSGQGIVSAPVALTSGGEPANDGDADVNSNLTVDFGMFLPASLGSIVWYDTDKDGVRDSGEAGVAGVIVTLYDTAGNSIATTTTDSTGYYQFTDLPPGTYRVGFSNLPTGYTFTQPNQGGNDNNDSDADLATGLTSSITLVPGQNNPTLYAGIVPITPTAITLASFTATPAGDTIAVRWVTSAEFNTWGFYLYRSTDGIRDHAIQITPELIPGRGRGQGASYAWDDATAEAGVMYSYWLQEVELNGNTKEYGPVRVANGTAGMRYRIFLPLAGR